MTFRCIREENFEIGIYGLGIAVASRNDQNRNDDWKKVSHNMAYNDRGLAKWRYSVIGQPGVDAFKKYEVEITNNFLLETESTWLKPIRELKMRIYSEAAISPNRMLSAFAETSIQKSLHTGGSIGVTIAGCSCTEAQSGR